MRYVYDKDKSQWVEITGEGPQVKMERLFRECGHLTTHDILSRVLSSDHRKIICRLKKVFEAEGKTIVNKGIPGRTGDYWLVDIPGDVIEERIEAEIPRIEAEEAFREMRQDALFG